MTAGAAMESAPKRAIMSWSVTAAIVGYGFRGCFARVGEEVEKRNFCWEEALL